VTEKEFVWAKPSGSATAHVFYGNKTLCETEFFGKAPSKPDFHTVKEECRNCKKRLKEIDY